MFINTPGPPILLHTENGGETWEDRSFLTDKALSAVYFNNQNLGWVAGNGIILHTTDGGQNWDEQWTGNYELRDIFFISEDTGWAVGDSFPQNYQIKDKGVLLKTTDGGDLWEAIYFEDWFRLNKVFFL